jgi:uncharacterized protein YbjT (DUF2867 family)
MNVLLFGATGMVGQAALRECLLDPGVQKVVAVVRSSTGQQNQKLQELRHDNFLDYSAVEGKLSGFDACFFCLGATSAGLNEEQYSRVTYEFAMAAGRVLARLNPGMTFIFISGQGADSTERGRIMWARIKGKTENALLALPFKAVYVFRPGMIQPLHGITSRTKAYRVVYALTGPLLPLLKRLFPAFIITTEELGRALLKATRQGAPKKVLENRDINRLVEG